MSPRSNPITALKDDVQKAATTTLLLEFDRSWWTIREKLDSYLDAAETQNNAFTSALTALDDYTTKCSADFTTLNKAHVQAQRADSAAATQLFETWHAAEHELGLIAARLADSKGFLKFAQVDAAAADFATNRTTICGQGEAAKAAALLAVNQSFSRGFAKQTWKQLLDAFNEMDFLRSRFPAMGMQTPSNATLVQAADRAAESFMEVFNHRSDIAVQAVQRACGQEQTSEQAPITPDNVKSKDVALKMIEDAEKEKELGLKQQRDLEAHKAEVARRLQKRKH